MFSAVSGQWAMAPGHSLLILTGESIMSALLRSCIGGPAKLKIDDYFKLYISFKVIYQIFMAEI